MKHNVLLAIVLMMTLVFAGCKSQGEPEQTAYDRPLPPGQFALRKIVDTAQVPDFTMACLDHAGLRSTIDNSLSYLGKPSSELFFPSGDITHRMAVESLEAFAALIDSGVRGSQLNSAIRAQFDTYMSIGCDDRGTVLFTGYYTPIFDGSTRPDARFRYPLYEQPDDLAKGPDGAILGRRNATGQISPYPTRDVIEQTGILKGKELIWLADAFEAYIAHVQGSAKIRLPNGSLTTIGYAANNGQEYHSVGQELVADGRIASDQLSLSAMIRYFKENQGLIDTYVRRNPRFVFFQEEDGPPRGSLNEPVTTMRTIATDKSIFPRGCLAFISTTMPSTIGGQPNVYSGFALDQDTGGAIRAPGRCDVYMGVGDAAGERAGQTYQEGKLYYLFLKPTASVGTY